MGAFFHGACTSASAISANWHQPTAAALFVLRIRLRSFAALSSLLKTAKRRVRRPISPENKVSLFTGVYI